MTTTAPQPDVISVGRPPLVLNRERTLRIGLPTSTRTSTTKRFVVPTLLIVLLPLWLLVELPGATSWLAPAVVAVGFLLRAFTSTLFRHARAGLLSMAFFLFAAPTMLAASAGEVTRTAVESAGYYLPFHLAAAAVGVGWALWKRRHRAPLAALAVCTAACAGLADTGLLVPGDALFLATLSLSSMAGYGLSRLWRMSIFSGWVFILMAAVLLWGGYRTFDTHAEAPPATSTSQDVR